MIEFFKVECIVYINCWFVIVIILCDIVFIFYESYFWVVFVFIYKWVFCLLDEVDWFIGNFLVVIIFVKFMFDVYFFCFIIYFENICKFIFEWNNCIVEDVVCIFCLIFFDNWVVFRFLYNIFVVFWFFFLWYVWK